MTAGKTVDVVDYIVLETCRTHRVERRAGIHFGGIWLGHNGYM
jgi:hypothetical protein